MTGTRFAVLAWLGAVLATSAASAADSLLNPLFQDRAVLQRGSPIAVWGIADAGATVTVTLADQSAEAHADGSGRWRASLAAMPAGGPYSLTASVVGGQSQSINDILIGDVYLCSGQSNMVLAVRDTIDSGAEIDISANDRIRLATIANATSPVAIEKLSSPVAWQAAGPASVPGFSGACYYFARELQKTVHVPLGLIESAWNGANITTFMSAAALHKAGGYDQQLEALDLYAKDPASAMRRWGELTEAWWHKHLGGEPWSNADSGKNWPVAPEGLGYWSEWPVPAVARYTGQMWMRTSVTLDAAQAAEDAVLSLGKINAEDQTWVNGRFIADTFAYATPRNYDLRAGMLHEGANDILVNVTCGWRSCGMFGPPQDRMLRLKDGAGIALNGPWHYQTVAPGVGQSPALPWGATAGTSVAYNAMIAPLAPYGLRGVVWYQGESNTGNPDEYRSLLPAMMADWRSLFGADLPFLIVQLPDYGLPPVGPEESGWARLRESQRAVAAQDRNAALAVTIDIGDHFGLHPSNKQEVGRRLSLAARRLIYGNKHILTGPTPVSAARAKGVVAVRFANVNGRLVAYNADQPIGFELCGAAEKSCRFAAAQIHADTVKLAIPRGLQPTHVRYCWANGPVCTLYDAERLPAVPFDLSLAAAPKSRAKAHSSP